MCTDGAPSPVPPVVAAPQDAVWSGEVVGLDPIDSVTLTTVCDNTIDIFLILRRYTVCPHGARTHIPVDSSSSMEDLEAAEKHIPIFLIRSKTVQPTRPQVDQS